MARVGLKGAWLEAARLSRHRAHSLLSRVFVATKERTCVLLYDVSSSSSSSSNDNPPNDEWTERIIIPWKREEEERRQRHLHHLFVCVIFFISFHLQCVSLRVSECVFADLCATTEFLSFSSFGQVKSVCVYLLCMSVCVCIIFWFSTVKQEEKEDLLSLSLSLDSVCLRGLDCHPKSVFWLRLLAALCVVIERIFPFSVFQGHTRCHRSVTAGVASFSDYYYNLVISSLCPSSVGDLLGALCARQKKREERRRRRRRRSGVHPPHTHTPKIPYSSSRAASRFSSFSNLPFGQTQSEYYHH